MNFYTYILESESSGMLYIGQTSDLDERLTRHNTGNSRFTKGKGPWKMIFSINLESRSEAIFMEQKLKGFKNRDRIKKWIALIMSKLQFKILHVGLKRIRMVFYLNTSRKTFNDFISPKSSKCS